MFTFQNGMGTSLDSLGGHSNSSFKKSINVENSARNVQVNFLENSFYFFLFFLNFLILIYLLFLLLFLLLGNFIFFYFSLFNNKSKLKNN